ncbi:helix-turn-helix domain-containing protein [Peptoniphilus sp. MSJ-1]|uniref:Helix-turn-helix domain-containing protein n=1 Tax=Peptoniphilus ovalis TaxID=2841503 RepID=A0ABS6FHH4_9FIRM|nr:helix-turn-helix domain-containing protein [Peptoniphilus ovalis]MBU5669627.1 helix-turn-helix domain-containing protein [Peptoniphilus ovalis]
MQEYYINIPSKVLENKNLSDKAKILYGQINRLSSKGNCWASNKYLGDLIDATPRTVTRLIKKLKDNYLIKIETEIIQGISQRKIICI